MTSHVVSSGAGPNVTLARALVVGLIAGGMLLAAILSDPAGVLLFSTFAGIGAYLAIRRPRNSVGWLLMMTGWGLAFGRVQCDVPLDVLLAGRLDPLQAVTAWANGYGWSFVFIGFFGVTLVFPRGHLPGGRGRWPSRAAVGAMIGLAVLTAIGPTINVTLTSQPTSVDVPNPFALFRGAGWWAFVPDPSLLFAMMFAVFATGLVAMVVRARRSVGLERLQYRWLVTAIVLVAIASISWAVTTILLEMDPNGVPVLFVVVSYPTVPIAIAFAILRYRLYDIDRILSRTIAYATVTAIVAGVFGAAVLLLSTGLASFAQGQTIAVAASTLAAYAIFQPVLRRVRRDVDRRFDRRRYDGERTAISFSARLRDVTNMEAVTGDLVETITSAVAPASLSLWLRSRDTTS